MGVNGDLGQQRMEGSSIGERSSKSMHTWAAGYVATGVDTTCNAHSFELRGLWDCGAGLAPFRQAGL